MREGRFSNRLADVALRYSESVSFDSRLFKHDIAGSIAHARALERAGILTEEEVDQIASGLRAIEEEITRGEFRWDPGLEDVHMNIEAALTNRIGAAGAKLHTARSRNDQVAVDLRLYVKAEIANIRSATRELQRALIKLADEHVEAIMPGYTHLQRAQPVLFAHYLLGQVEALARDDDRLNDCAKRADVMPLGSGAIAGSTIVLDREFIAQQLGFGAISQNSMDAVSDRDFVAELLFCLALIGTHLSRFSEDLIIWSTSEFGFISFGDAFATGSSLMPQKKNPDMAELTRGKTGRLYGNLVSVLTLLKGLPSTYNRDLQEDKEPLFDSVDTVTAALRVFSEMLPTLTINSTRMADAASDPNLLATDMAEELVKSGMPFREAHKTVGELAARAAEMGPTLAELFRTYSADAVDARESLRRRTATGAPSPENVRAQIARWRELLAC